MGFEDILKEILSGMGGRIDSDMSMPGPKPVPSPADQGGVASVMRDVVQVVALRQTFMGGMSSAWTGSGTLIDPSGIILTNCHVANPRAMGMSSPPADRLGIAITERSDAPPAISYFAEVVAQDPRLDRGVADVHGGRTSELELDTVDLGDSDTLQLGDKLAIFGYPDIGGETVTFTSGNVSGFSRQEGVRPSRAWIKTDATIAGGNSDGTAVNEAGQLVGIPTQAAAGTGVTPVDARPVLDTNRDGRIDQRDTPMAVGGFINGLRPVNLAFPLLEKAGIKIKIERPGRVRRSSASPSIFDDSTRRQQEFSHLLFSSSITQDGRPINPSTYIPEGVETVYATFEYSDMQNGTPWSVVWMTGGQQIIDQDDRWDDGPKGRKAVKVSNRKGVSPGEYHLVLGIGGSVTLEGKVMVGNPVDETNSEISGRLVDGSSQRSVANGLVMVLKPRTSLGRFLRTQDRSMILTSAESGQDGRFTFPDQSPKGQAYSLVALARGYQPVAVEGALRLSGGAPEQADIGEIEMAVSP